MTQYNLVLFNSLFLNSKCIILNSYVAAVEIRDRLTKQKRLDKFVGQQICDAESYPKGSAEWMQPDQLLDQKEGWFAKQLHRSVLAFNRNRDAYRCADAAGGWKPRAASVTGVKRRKYLGNPERF